MQPDLTDDRYDLKRFLGRRFGLKGSVKWYTLTTVRRVAAGKYEPAPEGNEIALYASGDEGEELVGFVTAYEYSFKVTREIYGVSMSKELAFNELIFKKK